MITYNLVQGSDEWKAYRMTARNASEASAMLGCSPYLTRTALMKAKHTGILPEVAPEQQKIFDRGIEIERALRPVAAAILGEELFASVGSAEVGGIILSASFDGLNMMEEVNWECKSLNDELRAAMPNPGPDGNDAAQLPKHYRVQMEQQCAVSGCKAVLFTGSDGNGDDRHCFYLPSPSLRREIIAGWKQFDKDLAEYMPTEVVAVPVGRSPENLPALRIEVTGMVTASNLDVFKEHAISVIGSINRSLNTEQDFADAKKAMKWCSEVKTRIQAAKQHALSQTQPIDYLFATLEAVGKLADDTRLELEKLVKLRNEALKIEIVSSGVVGLRNHIAVANARLRHNYMPVIPADFPGAIRNKSNFDNMRDAVATELARAKIAADEMELRISTNMQKMVDVGDKAHFPDSAQLVLKDPDDLAAIIAVRVAEANRKVEAQRESIRAEEAAKLKKEQADLEEAEKRLQAKKAESEAQQVFPELGTVEILPSDEVTGLFKQPDNPVPVRTIYRAGGGRRLADVQDVQPVQDLVMLSAIEAKLRQLTNKQLGEVDYYLQQTYFKS
jgi:predicted phage-related endonuclease